MAPIDEAIADLESRDPGEKFTLKEVAEKWGVNRSTLGRRWRRVTGPRSDGYAQQQAIGPQQELELVRYITKLTKQGLPPTREMIRNFSSEVAHQQLSESWVTRFINRHEIYLISKWTTAMDRTRHLADSESKYRLYFELLHQKITEYHLEARDIYNMDEKGFLIGMIGRSKRIFSRRQWDKKEVRASLQDGSREFLTLLACCCADGSSLPPALIYAAKNGAIRSSWVEDIKAGEHEVFVSSSLTGWSNNDVGLAWLEQVFDRYTKQRSGRWRLLILDGHGSHLTMEFIKYCDRHRILLMILPPHSTHTLQPLDVVLFKPLSQAYSNELTNHLYKAQGLIPIKKGDFFPLFWRAWQASFKQSTILKAFEATGIWPIDPNVILRRFASTPEAERSSSSGLSDHDWRKLDRLVRAAVNDSHQYEARKLRSSVHHLSVQYKLLQHENEGLKEALQHKKKHKKKGKALDLQQRQEYHGGSVFWSPRKIREARAREVVRERDKIEEKLQKAQAKKQREEVQLQRQVKLEEKRVERQRLKEIRELERAEKAAERARKVEAQHQKKATQQAQQRKRKASRAPSSKNKRQKRAMEDRARDRVASPPSPPPPKTTSRGRNVNLPQKFR
ncbi:TolA, Membrane protein involved in colicin uptake [Pyrenophora tritici-repentis]|uniref:TolA, Membrane protein involved in colicin uptake n=3 Tax=Pyrenophora tritici-repentis TaxID=45151 RepID=A0A834RQV0_9PLEO|nr:TolA, Membrane protein involved in colicin uptake [Pyrenophora tritici-repentis]KAF7566552.1 TolA, Membrane protein involved in colicin uptake [Pyrenophora tritici-repentis]KAF7567594.1 TolA, Membrane protein involved in colicin uptake [Pyrenophora tritici-repentis]KAF7567942.1 TolA, Membrane protein involved in colicin uptake [Pyrenophora tritici-repentis]KAF7568510.1 TolA, Membrane protein involved in colicin uptake [Pyrenophora tritici-repentis]